MVTDAVPSFFAVLLVLLLPEPLPQPASMVADNAIARRSAPIRLIFIVITSLFFLFSFIFQVF
jgi:hypothetical protein